MRRAGSRSVWNVGLVWILVGAVALAEQGPITNADVLKMLAAGLSDGVVVAAIEGAPQVGFELTPDALIKLKAAGASNGVITAMLARGARPAAASADLAIAPVPAASTLLVPENTEIPLRLVRRITSADARVEDEVVLEVARDVVIGGQVIFQKGARARGKVTEAANARSFGRSGKLSFSIDGVEAMNGQMVRVDTSRALKGDGRVGATVAAVVLVGVFGGFVKGKNIEVPAGTEYITYTVGDRSLDLSSQPVQARPVAVQQATPPAFVSAVAPSPSDLVGSWNLTLPNTRALVGATSGGGYLLDLQGQYSLQGILKAEGAGLTGTVRNACMPDLPITMTAEAGGWTVRAEYADCLNNRPPIRITFRMMR